MVEKRPQPRNIDSVGGKIIHEPQLELVVVDRRGEVAVEDLEAVVRRHVERVLDVLNGDHHPWAPVDGFPKFLSEEFLRRIQGVLGDDPGRDLALSHSISRGIAATAAPRR